MNTRHELAILNLKATHERLIDMAASCSLAMRDVTPPIVVKGHIERLVHDLVQLKRDIDAAKRNFNLALEQGDTDA